MCDCEICTYTRKYEEAIENNDKKFLMEHFNYFVNIDFDNDCMKFEREFFIKFLKEKNLFCEYKEYRNK
jgi:hypothetical protein